MQKFETLAKKTNLRFDVAARNWEPFAQHCVNLKLISTKLDDFVVLSFDLCFILTSFFYGIFVKLFSAIFGDSSP